VQLSDIPFCRDDSYYVDPDSTEIVEIGTLKYPYKNIGLVFLELLNIRAHSESNIVIYVKENTIVNMQLGYNYIANITSVTIESYSDSSSTPAKATLYVRQYTLDMFDEHTSFNLVSDNTLDLNSKINVENATDSEIAVLGSTDTTLFAWRSSLTLNNLNIQGDLDNDSQVGSYFMRIIYLQEKFLTLKELDIQLTGYLLRSFDPMSMDIENVYVDFHAMMGGFWMNIACNYPEAHLDGILRSKNLTAVNAFTRIAPFRTPFMVTSGPEDIYFEDSNIYVWGSLSEDRAVIETLVNTD
jgi:hypothetical protein